MNSDSSPTRAVDVFSPEYLKTASWEDVELLYRELASRPLPDADAVTSWLADWDAIDRAVVETANQALFDAARNSTDEDAARRYAEWNEKAAPLADQYRAILGARLLDTPDDRPELRTTRQRFAADQKRACEANVPLLQHHEALMSRYGAISGRMQSAWNGERIPASAVKRFFADPDRTVREAAWRAYLAPYLDARDELADLFDELLAVRTRIAKQAGFTSFIDYMYAQYHRFDYTPADTRAFTDSIATVFGNVVRGIRDRRAHELGITRCRPWDTTASSRHDAAPSYPTVRAMTDALEHMLRRLDPSFGDDFAAMRAAGTFDLDVRLNKRPGGFSYPLPWTRSANIFMNGTGSIEDLRILAHEAGHAFHSHDAYTHVPFIHAAAHGEEIAELASISMEFFITPFLHESHGGPLDDLAWHADARHHLEQRICGLPMIAAIDSFQQWLYTDPAAADRDARDATWSEIHRTFDPGVDWTGLEAEQGAWWYRILHIWQYPLYYIEYAIATLGALQLREQYRSDPERTVADYRAMLRLGGTRPLSELYEVAGARLIFSTGEMLPIARNVATELNIEACPIG